MSGYFIAVLRRICEKVTDNNKTGFIINIILNIKENIRGDNYV
jgi:hypothetical protein